MRLPDVASILGGPALAPQPPAPSPLSPVDDMSDAELAAHVGHSRLWKGAAAPREVASTIDRRVPQDAPAELVAEAARTAVLDPPPGDVDPAAIMGRVASGRKRMDEAVVHAVSGRPPEVRVREPEEPTARMARLQESVRRVREVAADPTASEEDAVRSLPFVTRGAARESVRAAEVLARALPQAPGPDPLGQWRMDDAQALRAERLLRAAEDPASVLERFPVASWDELEVVRELQPARWAELGRQLEVRVRQSGMRGLNRRNVAFVLGPDFMPPVPTPPEGPVSPMTEELRQSRRASKEPAMVANSLDSEDV